MKPGVPSPSILAYSFLLLAGPVFFGAVHSWAYLTMTAVLFLILGLDPGILDGIKLLPRLVSGGFFVLFALLFLQIVFFSVNRYDTFQETLKWSALVVAFLFVLKNELSVLEALCVLILIVGVLESLYALYQIAQDQESVLWRIKKYHLDYATGTYFNRNHLAGLLQLCLGLNLGMIVTARERKRRWQTGLWILTAFLMTAGFLKTGSRMGFISFAGALLLMLPSLKYLSAKLRILLLFILACVFCLMLFGTREIISERFHESYASLQTWDGGRLIAWQDSMKMLAHYPGLGIGLGNFEWVFPQYQSSQLLLGWDHAHNDYVELLTELGVLGFLIWLFAWGSFFAYCATRLKKVKTGAFGIVWGSLLSLAAYAFHGLTDFNSALYANVFLFVTLAAVIFRFMTDSTGRYRMKNAGGLE